MPNIKSQKKRVLTNNKRNASNSSARTELKTAIKNVIAAVDANDKEAAVKAFDNANKLLDKAVASNIKHSNYAARQKSRLAKAVNSVK